MLGGEGEGGGGGYLLARVLPEFSISNLLMTAALIEVQSVRVVRIRIKLVRLSNDGQHLAPLLPVDVVLKAHGKLLILPNRFVQCLAVFFLRVQLKASVVFFVVSTIFFCTI